MKKKPPPHIAADLMEALRWKGRARARRQRWEQDKAAGITPAPQPQPKPEPADDKRPEEQEAEEKEGAGPKQPEAIAPELAQYGGPSEDGTHFVKKKPPPHVQADMMAAVRWKQKQKEVKQEWERNQGGAMARTITEQQRERRERDGNA